MLVLVLALPAWGAQPRRATLKLVSPSPLVVHGLGFGQRERIVLIANGSGRRQAAFVTARRDGSFRARFVRIRLGRCDALTVRATGTAGSRAILQREPGCEEDDDDGDGRKRRKPA